MLQALQVILNNTMNFDLDRYALHGVDATQVRAAGEAGNNGVIALTASGAPVQASVLSRLCVAKCFDVDHYYHCNDELFTLLHLAIWWELEHGLRLLLELGADPMKPIARYSYCAPEKGGSGPPPDDDPHYFHLVLAEDPWKWAGMSTLGFACMLGSHAIVAALVESGATQLVENAMGVVLQSADDELMVTAFLGRFPLMRHLYEHRETLLKDTIDAAVAAGAAPEAARDAVFKASDARLSSALQNYHSAFSLFFWAFRVLFFFSAGCGGGGFFWAFVYHVGCKGAAARALRLCRLLFGC